jgi:hypothetical protein
LEEGTANIFGVKEQPEEANRQTSTRTLLAVCLCDLFLDPEDEGSTFFRNIDIRLEYYRVSQARKQSEQLLS